MPAIWKVHLTGPVNAPIPLTAPHAVISRWLDDPVSGPAIGADEPGSAHGGRVKKWACGPPQASRGDHTGTGIVLDVRLLDDRLNARLRSAAATGTSVRLGACRYQIGRPPRMIAEATWPELRHWPGTRAWQVRFASPACTRRRNRTSPLLAPDALARGLAERWQALDPATAPEVTWRGSGPIWVSDLEGSSQVNILSRRNHRDSGPPRQDEIISGFTGRVRYVCDDGTRDEAASFDALIAFAQFAGAGSHTAYGFGTVVAETTWQPPSVHETSG
jgi:CRISPR-associated endoribonuclease Cas6